MKFTVKREELISVLSDYSSILRENPIKPILEALYVEVRGEEVIFMGRNVEMEYKRRLACEAGAEEGSVLLKPSLILEYVKLLEEDMVSVEKLDASLKIARGEFSILDDAAYPEIQEKTSMSIQEVEAKDLVRVLEKMKFAVAASPDNLALNCVRVCFQSDKTEFVATDSYRLLFTERAWPSELEKEISLPLDAAQVIVKLLKDKEGKVALELSGDYLLILWDSSYFACRLTMLPFPNYRDILQVSNFDKEMEFRRDDLKAGMKRVMTVAKTSLDAKYGGLFQFQGKNLAVNAFSGKAKTKQKIPMMKQGEDFKASLNCKYLAEFLDIISENVILHGKNSSSMFRIEEAGNDNLVYILMPLALRES